MKAGGLNNGFFALPFLGIYCIYDVTTRFSNGVNNGNNKITELRTIFQRE
jgi:hypothetical protein